MLDERVRPLSAELAAISRDLEELRDKVENVIDYRKEIDHALERIAQSRNTSASTRKSPPDRVLRLSLHGLARIPHPAHHSVPIDGNSLAID
jgi:hypothetical protein